MKTFVIIPKTAKTRLLFFVIADAIFIVLAVWLALFLRFEGSIPARYLGGSLQSITLLFLVTTIPIFLFFRLYSFTWAYMGINDLLKLAKGLVVSFIIAGGIFFFFRDQGVLEFFPRSVVPVSYILMFFLMGGLRFTKRAYMYGIVPSFRNSRREKERVLIVGAGDAGEQIVRSIQQSPRASHIPVGFVDDDVIKQGTAIHGVGVLGTTREIERIAQTEKVDTLIIALSSAKGQDIRRAVEAGRSAGLKKIQIIPALAELVDGQVSFRNLREVQMEDLLGRATVPMDEGLVGKFIRGRRVLITGAAGSIGSELARQIAKFSPSSIILLDQDETGIFYLSNELQTKFKEVSKVYVVADVCDKQKIHSIFDQYKPEIVFHAAAYKHVPLMEEYPDEALKNNVFGTMTVAKVALDMGAEKFVLISTDKAVNPASVMGMTKRMGEMICQMFNQRNRTKFVSVRFGNVLDSRGSVIPIFRKQIEKGGPVTVTHEDMQRYFMSTSEACLLVMEAAALGDGGEVFVLDMGEPVKIVDLAREMIRLSGFEPDKDIPIVFTGVRPGEKMFENILTAEEGTVATKSKKIFQARLSEVNASVLEKHLEELRNTANTGVKEKIRESLKRIVSGG